MATSNEIDILGLGDSHFEEGPRFEECKRVHGWIAERVRERRPDLVVHGGDIYEKASTPLERLAAAAFAQAIANVCPVVIVGGNHDAPHDCELLRELQAAHPIRVVEGAEVFAVSTRRGVVGIGALGWPRMAGATTLDAARDAMRDVLRAVRDPLSAYPRRLLVGHFECDGAVTSSGQPMVGRGLDLSLGDLALAGAQAVIMGHIHKPQGFEHDGVPMLYTGSPFRTSFGENEEKSVLELRLGPDGASWQRVPTPARAMLFHEAWWHMDRGEWGWSLEGDATLPDQPGVDYAGADVRVRYHVLAEARDIARSEAAALKAGLLAKGAAHVKVEEQVEATVRARAPEIAAARTLPEKLEALWRSRGQLPPPERAERLLGPRLATLETTP